MCLRDSPRGQRTAWPSPDRPATQVTCTPQRSADRLAFARPTGEKSTPVTSQPCSASQIEFATLTAGKIHRPARRKSDDLSNEELAGRARPHQLVAAVVLVPLLSVHCRTFSSSEKTQGTPGAQRGEAEVPPRALAGTDSDRSLELVLIDRTSAVPSSPFGRGTGNGLPGRRAPAPAPRACRTPSRTVGRTACM